MSVFCDMFHVMNEAPQDKSQDCVNWRNHLKEGNQTEETDSYKQKNKDQAI
jgi:hypothetical protein